MNEIIPPKMSDSLAKIISDSKDFAVVSLWWLSVPFFIVFMLLIKEAYIPGSAFVNDIHEFALREKYTSISFFLIAPILLIIVNGLMIMKIRSLTGNPKSWSFLPLAWSNVLIVILCLVVVFIYSL